jgi:hypothetical protein
MRQIDESLLCKSENMCPLLRLNGAQTGLLRLNKPPIALASGKREMGAAFAACRMCCGAGPTFNDLRLRG